MSELDALVVRVRELECENARGKRWRTVFLAAIGCLLFQALRSPDPKYVEADEVQAKKFTLVNEQGHGIL